MESRKRQFSDEQFRLLVRFLRVVRETTIIEPGGGLDGDPVCLRRMAFPTVEQVALLSIADVDAKRLVGQQKFEEVSLRRVDFAQSELDFSVWSRCHFEEVSFDRASLRNCRFFGCEFRVCSFLSTECANAAFSVGVDGTETSFRRCQFENARLRGVSWCKPSFAETSFIRCRFGQSEFDGASFEASRFVGHYDELTFRGDTSIGQRNCLDIDMTSAEVTWLNANHGVDLSCLRLLPLGPSIVVLKREEAIPAIAKQLGAERREAQKLARMLENIFTEKSVSPLASSQQTVYISVGLIRELDESLSKDQAEGLLRVIREIAFDKGFAAR